MAGKKKGKLTGFGYRLMEVAELRGIGDTGSLANAIFSNKDCRKIVKIRVHKKYETPFDEMESIRRNIQNHLSEKYSDAYKVPSAYMYAYSIVLDCSLDYLYGRSEIKASNLEVRDICNKTGLSEGAVVNLMERHKEEIESDGFSYNEWWSELLYDSAFMAIPMSWKEYASRLVELHDIDKKIEACEKAGKDAPMSDSIMIYLMDDDNQKTLRSIRRDKADAILGAHHKMNLCVEDFLDRYAKQWAEEQHPEYSEIYYHSEINKRKIIDAAVKI